DLIGCREAADVFPGSWMLPRGMATDADFPVPARTADRTAPSFPPGGHHGTVAPPCSAQAPRAEPALCRLRTGFAGLRRGRYGLPHEDRGPARREVVATHPTRPALARTGLRPAIRRRGVGAFRCKRCGLAVARRRRLFASPSPLPDPRDLWLSAILRR